MYSFTSPSLSGYPKRFVMEIKRTYKTSFTTLSRILRVLPEVDIREIDQALDEIDKLLFSLPLNNKGYREFLLHSESIDQSMREGYHH